jgi:protein TonB
METKKSPQKDLENKKGYFLQVGIIVSLALVLIAFEWSSTDVRVDYFKLVEDTDIVIDLVPISVHKEKELDAPKPIVVDVLLISDDPDIFEEPIYIPEPEDVMGDLSKVQPTETEEREPIYFSVEEMPKFPGGEAALFKYLANEIEYPQIAQINGVQGRVYVSFVVNKKGEITQVELARSVDPNLDREALRVVSSMPQWKPGRQNNELVSVSFTIPISFVLE